MGYQIPNTADALVAGQASPDKVDFDLLTAPFLMTGVASGCTVTPQGAPNMTVQVAAGAIYIAGTPVAVAAVSSLTVTAAHASLNRFDLVTVNNAGTVAYTTGTASANPVFPAIPSNSTVLAAVYVPAAATSIVSADIVDKRVLLRLPDEYLAYIYF